MICKKCNGKGYIYTNAFGTKGILRCDVCGGNGKILSNQQTNEEWFASLPTEEKAKFLRQIYRDGRDDYVGEWYERTEADFVQWLKEIHE